jgi:hypothetical protein
MKKLTRLLCLGIIAFFVLAGPAGATQIVNFYHPYEEILWATLTAEDPVDTGSGYTYQYTLENVEGPAIHMLQLAIGDYTTISFLEVTGEPLKVDPPAVASNTVYYTWDGLASGESSSFGFTVDLSPGPGKVLIINGGASNPECVSTGMVEYVGSAGSDPVPEPATLLLLGSGLLSAAAARRFGIKRFRKS